MGKLIVPQIETERCLMRQVSGEYLEAWARLKYADPEMMRYMPVSELEPLDRARAALEFFEAFWPEHGFGAWMVFDRQDGRLLGDCYVDPAAVSDSGEVEIGYDIGREFWGRGFATEIARAALRFTFETSSAPRILGVVEKNNAGSRRVLERLGFKPKSEAEFYGLDAVIYVVSRAQFTPGDAIYRVRDNVRS